MALVRTLVIEDDAGDLELLRRCLAGLPDYAFEITVYDRPEPALDMLLRCEVDVVFLDYQLGDATGFDLLRPLRQAGCRTPVIVLTGQGSEQLAVELMKAGATDYLAKSLLKQEALAHVLRNALHIGELERRAREVEEARRNEEVSRRLVAIQEEERRRLATELHDRTSPNLSALAINLALIADMLPQRQREESAQLIEDSRALLDDTIASIRAISSDFRPQILDYAGFWSALESYALQFARRTGIALRTAKTEPDARLAPELGTNLFRIAQQAMHYCARYSLSQTIYVDYRKDDGGVALSIADDGVGFDMRAVPFEGAQELATMRERAEFIGGRFGLEVHPGRGTRITVALPADRQSLDGY